MSNDFKIVPGVEEDIQKVVKGLNAYNLSQVAASAATWTPLEYMAKDSHENLIGGILAGIGYWNGLEVKILWVKEAYRKQGIGSQLLAHVETIARQKGAIVSMLDTFDFQAENFYLKNGYASIGELKDFPAPGKRRIYFSKQLKGQDS